MDFLSHVTCCSSLAALNIFPLSLVFNTLIIMCLRMDIFEFSYLESPQCICCYAQQCLTAPLGSIPFFHCFFLLFLRFNGFNCSFFKFTFFFCSACPNLLLNPLVSFSNFSYFTIQNFCLAPFYNFSLFIFSFCSYICSLISFNPLYLFCFSCLSIFKSHLKIFV